MGNVRLTLAGVAVSGSLIAGAICVVLLIGPVIAFDAWPARSIGAGEGRALVVSDVPPAARALLGVGGFAPVRVPSARTSAAPVARSAAVTSSAKPRARAGSHRRHRRGTRRATPSASAVAASTPTSSAPSTGGGAKAPESRSTSRAGSESGSTRGASARSDTGASPTAAPHTAANKGKHKGKGNGKATLSSTATHTAPADTGGGTHSVARSTPAPPASDKGAGKKIPPGQAKKTGQRSDDGP
jgi:hypothetical protein